MRKLSKHKTIITLVVSASVLLAFCLSVIPFGIFSAVDSNTPAQAAIFGAPDSGDGSSNNPYIINTAADIRMLESMMNTYGDKYAGKYFRLANSIDMSDHSYKPGLPSGFRGFGPFRGIFDGNGHTIRVEMHYTDISTNRYADVNRTSQGDSMFRAYGGVFNVLEDGAEIRNLTVDGFLRLEVPNSNFSNAIMNNEGMYGVGGLFGFMQGNSRVTIENINIDITVIELNSEGSTGSGMAYVGGLGGCVKIGFNPGVLGSNDIYVSLDNISINAPVSAAKEESSVGGVFGFFMMVPISDTFVNQRVITEIKNSRLDKQASVTSSGADSICGGFIGSQYDRTYVMASDLDIINYASIYTPSGVVGSVSGYIHQSSLLTGVNIRINENIEAKLASNRDSDGNIDKGWLEGKLFTFQFREIPNMNVNFAVKDDIVDTRGIIDSNVVVNENNLGYTLSTTVRDEDKLFHVTSVETLLNTKLTVVQGGKSVAEANLEFSGVTIYSREFTINVTMSFWDQMSDFMKFFVIIGGIGLVYALWEIVVMKKYRNIASWHAEIQEIKAREISEGGNNEKK